MQPYVPRKLFAAYPRRSVKLVSPISVSSNSPPGPFFTFPDPDGTIVHLGCNPIFVIKVTQVPTGGSGQSIQLNIQSSVDDGQTWNDCVWLGGVTSPGTYYAPVSTVAPFAATYYPPLQPIQDDVTHILAGSGAAQGPLGNRFRLSYNANMGTGTTGLWSFQAYVLP
jgi:hypothetical protein